MMSVSIVIKVSAFVIFVCGKSSYEQFNLQALEYTLIIATLFA